MTDHAMKLRPRCADALGFPHTGPCQAEATVLVVLVDADETPEDAHRLAVEQWNRPGAQFMRAVCPEHLAEVVDSDYVRGAGSQYRSGLAVFRIGVL